MVLYLSHKECQTDTTQFHEQMHFKVAVFLGGELIFTIGLQPCMYICSDIKVVPV